MRRQESLADDQRHGLAEKTFIPTVQKRGAAIIEARGCPPRERGDAAMDHVRDWVQGTRPGNWVSMGVLRTGATAFRKA